MYIKLSASRSWHYYSFICLGTFFYFKRQSVLTKKKLKKLQTLNNKSCFEQYVQSWIPLNQVVLNPLKGNQMYLIVYQYTTKLWNIGIKDTLYNTIEEHANIAPEMTPYLLLVSVVKIPTSLLKSLQ